MPNSHLIQLADAVVTVLNGTSLGLSFTAARNYSPRFELKDLATLQVSVRPAGDLRKGLGRGIVAHTYAIEIGILQLVADASAATVDPLTEFVEAIADLFHWNRITGRKEVCTDAAVIIYDLPALAQNTEFRSLVTLQFYGEREP